MKYLPFFLFIMTLSLILNSGSAQPIKTSGTAAFTYDKMPDVLPGTQALTMQGEIADAVMDGAHKFIEAKIAESPGSRQKLWNRNFSSAEAYSASIEANRKRFIKCIGMEDKSEPFYNYNSGLPDENPPAFMQKLSFNNDAEIVAETEIYKIYQVRWSALNRVYGEGLLIQPKTKPVANIIAIPDADQTPEQLAGLAPGIPENSQFARRLAENGYQVLIPVLISRTPLFPGKNNQQNYREWLYRQAFHMGRHLIGYEVVKIMAAVDWFKQYTSKDLKIGLAGYCEGGLIAFYSAAVDKRIDAVLVSGYFNNRQMVWNEPIERNVWGLLSEFGDAEITSLIAPRPIVIEYSSTPDIKNKGEIHTPQFSDVQAEFNRTDKLVKQGFQSRQLVADRENKPLAFGSQAALEKFTATLGNKSNLVLSDKLPVDSRKSFSPEARQIRQFKEIEDHVQWLLRDSDYERNRLFLFKIMPEFANKQWSTKSYHPYFPADRFTDQSKEFRKYFWEEILGKFDEPMLPQNPRTRKVIDESRWTGYEVVLDVYKDLIAYGVILIPKDIKPGERRPVVVCQHGRNGLPMRMVDGFNTGAKLANQGFIVYAPFNLYRGEDLYRWLDRKANTIKKTLFTFIIHQHDQTLQWLKTLPFVDPKRMGFYGISYGGETAMRVPAVLEDYCLSICSGDFGDWSRKVTDTHNARSFMSSIEWEMPYFNMGSTFSYAEMAYLIFPRPFMVERGHDDTVQPDEWVFYEYGKVKNLYDQFNMKENVDMEVFNGGHSMRGDGTFRFLHKHLNWP